MANQKVEFGHKGFKKRAKQIMGIYKSAWENVAYHTDVENIS